MAACDSEDRSLAGDPMQPREKPKPCNVNKLTLPEMLRFEMISDS
jgi:hypothetical protein